jgi:hypothetical protein
LFHIIGRDKRDALLFRQKASRSCVVQHSKIDLVMPGSGSKARITAPQHCCPLRPE